MIADRQKIIIRSLRKQIRLTKKYIKLAEKRKEIIGRLVDEKQELLDCLKTIDEYLGALPEREIDRLMDSPRFNRHVMRVLKKYLGEGGAIETRKEKDTA